VKVAPQGLAAFALLVLLTGCRRGEPPLQDLLREGYQELRHGNLDQAWLTTERGLQRSPGHPAGQSEWPFQVLKAEILVSRRRHGDALALLDTGLHRFFDNDAVRARALMTRGAAWCASSGELDTADRAIHDFEDAARIAESLGATELAADVALRRGTCHLQRNQLPEAEADFRAAYGAAREHGLHFVEANAAGSLGLLHVGTLHYDEGVDWLRRSLAITSSLKAEGTHVKNMNNLGWAYSMLGDYTRARPLLSQAVEVTSARGFTGDHLIALNLLGNTYLDEGQAGQAAHYYDRALAVAHELDSPSQAAAILVNLAMVELELGRHEAAASHVREALPLLAKLKNIRDYQISLFTEGNIWAAQGSLREAEARYRSLIASPQTPPDILWELYGALARMHATSKRPLEAEAEFARASAAMDEMRSSLHVTEHRITFFSSLRRFYDDYVDFLITSGQGKRALLVADQSRGRMLRDRLGDKRTAGGATDVGRLQDLARRLDAVLLSYWLAPQRSFLWIVTPNDVQLRILPDAATLGRDVDAYQAALLRSRDALGEETPEGQRLWRSLVGPAAAAIPPQARVILVPDGALYQINFETLLVPGPPLRYWIEDVTLAEAPSLSLLSDEPAPRQPGQQQLLAIGDPVPANLEFPRLAHAQREVQQIASLFEPDQRSVYSGTDADPSTYRKAHPERFHFIHFASHVTANRESPLDSAVVLSPRGDDYKLYARDVIGIPLSAELVTLSACRSAGSRTFAGEGLVGLAWAFLSSGAANVIGGLWNVEDASTALLMERLYGHLRQGNDPAAALRQAKLSLLRSGTTYRKPFYWAPFIAYTRRPRGVGPSREVSARVSALAR
jgi:CHAT domain-containing protein/tetratricopeptide (TPR) repeat protein